MAKPTLQWEQVKAHWPNAEASRFVRSGELCWHVQIAGPAPGSGSDLGGSPEHESLSPELSDLAPTAPTVLLLHGSGASTHSWGGVLAELARDFHVVAPDLPGHAFTDAPSLDGMSLPGMARALDALLETLKVEPDIIVGHSAGAAIAFQMVADGHAKPRLIISLNGAIQPFKGAGRHVFPALAKLVFLNPFAPRLFAWQARNAARVDELMQRSGSKLSAEDIAWYRMLFASSDHVNGALRMMASWNLEELGRRLPEVTVPVVLVAAEADGFVPAGDADTTVTRLPNATVRRIAGLGHLSHEEAPQETAELIRSLIACRPTPG